jgi:hypothetical protein
MEIKGKILEIMDTVQIKETFRKREFVVEWAKDPQYPSPIMFEIVQDRCEQLDGFRVGEEVTVHFDLRGRRWQSPDGRVKYFNTLQAWRLDPVAGSQPAPTQGFHQPPPVAPPLQSPAGATFAMPPQPAPAQQTSPAAAPAAPPAAAPGPELPPFPSDGGIPF